MWVSLSRMTGVKGLSPRMKARRRFSSHRDGAAGVVGGCVMGSSCSVAPLAFGGPPEAPLRPNEGAEKRKPGRNPVVGRRGHEQPPGLAAASVAIAPQDAARG